MSRRSLILIFIVGVLTFTGYGLAIYGFYAGRKFYVPSGSMMNTVMPGDRLMARKFSREVKRGQVLIFQYPGDSTYYLSRVLGLPNETLEVRGTSVYIDGNKRVNEEKVMVESVDPEDELKEISVEGNGRYRVFYLALAEGQRIPDPIMDGPHQIPAGHYFMMGDNRDNSEDSRYRGTVPRELIWGEPFIIHYSTTVKSGDIRWDRIFKSIQ